MSYIATFSGKRFDPVEPDETLIDIADIDDRMLSMEFHQMMKIEIDDSYGELLAEVICKCENPQNVETEFVSLAANV